MVTELETSKQWNPYLAMTPCCGKVFCVKCAEIAERINEVLDSKGSDESQAYGNRQSRRLQLHLDRYDHSNVEVWS
jgi:hypothetical protein